MGVKTPAMFGIHYIQSSEKHSDSDAQCHSSGFSGKYEDLRL